MAKYILPGIGGQLNAKGESPEQTSPLLRYYSPRLFGAPPQLTNQCDMRIMSSDGVNPGRSAFVESVISARTPLFPSSPKRARSITLSSIGV